MVLSYLYILSVLVEVLKKMKGSKYELYCPERKNYTARDNRATPPQYLMKRYRSCKGVLYKMLMKYD